MKTLADRAIWARTRLDLRQEDVAKRARVTQGTIGNIERGIRKNPRELLAIAHALRVRPEWLKSGTGPVEESQPPHFVTEAPAAYGSSLVAHAVSQRQPIVTLKTMVWEDLVREQIEGQFLMAIVGDSLAPTYLPGQLGIWEAGNTAKPGQPVLIALPGDRFELRLMETRGGSWAGVSQRAGHGELLPERDGAQIVARLRYLDLG